MEGRNLVNFAMAMTIKKGKKVFRSVKIFRIIFFFSQSARVQFRYPDGRSRCRIFQNLFSSSLTLPANKLERFVPGLSGLR
jgi:hypothetical protein